MQVEIWEFLKAVAHYWTAFLTGTALVALIWGYEHYKGESISWRIALWIMVLAAVVAVFFAWRYQYRGWIDERAYRTTVANDLATLRHSAQKRYYEWWEGCKDPQKFADGEKAAETMRQTIIAKLRKEVNAAEADYFNTPRMFEPFPANRTLVQCPKAPLINEFGYRVQRLGDIIQRLLQGPWGAHERIAVRRGVLG